MTIDDRLTRAGQQFRAAHTEPAPVHLAASGDARTPGRAPRRRRRFVGIALAAAAVVTLTVGVVAWLGSTRRDDAPRPAATTPAGPVSSLAAFTTGTWRLTAVATDSAPAVRPTYPNTLTVAPGQDGQLLNRDDDCNVTSVSVDIRSTAIRIVGQAVTTAVGCERPADPADAAQAPVFGATTIAWSIDRDILTLSAADVTLTYTPVTPSPPTAFGKVRTFWQLVGVVDAGNLVPVATARSTELQFDATPGTVTVGDGCNSLGGRYTLDGSTLVFADVATTDMACSDNDALRRAIGRVVSTGSVQATQAGDRLTLRRDDVVLVYDLVGAG